MATWHQQKAAKRKGFTIQHPTKWRVFHDPPGEMMVGLGEHDSKEAAEKQASSYRGGKHTFVLPPSSVSFNHKPKNFKEDVTQDMENTVNEAELDAELEAIIEEMRADGLSDDEIVTFFENLEESEEAANPENDSEEAPEEQPEQINLMEVADAVVNKEPAKIAAIFDAAIKERLSGMVDDYKKHIAQNMFADPEDEDDDEELEDDDSDDDSEGDCDDVEEGEVSKDETVPFRQ